MDEDIFLYVGGNQEVPKDVVRARIDPSVKIINEEAFSQCKALREVEFCEGLEEIGDGAFCCCKSLEYIRTPSTTRVIGEEAFYCCTSLKNVLFNEGLVEIKDMAFSSCSRLTNVCLPSTMRWLRKNSFHSCRILRIVALNEGLEEVGENVFVGCTMLQLIGIPLSVGYMDDKSGAFGIRMEMDRSDELWKKIHKHVVETANASDSNPAETGVSEVGDDFETIGATENVSSVNEKKLKAEIELLRNQVEEAATEKNILTQELAGMKRKFQENLSDLERIAKKLDNLEEEKDEE